AAGGRPPGGARAGLTAEGPAPGASEARDPQVVEVRVVRPAGEPEAVVAGPREGRGIVHLQRDLAVDLPADPAALLRHRDVVRPAALHLQVAPLHHEWNPPLPVL